MITSLCSREDTGRVFSYYMHTSMQRRWRRGGGVPVEGHPAGLDPRDSAWAFGFYRRFGSVCSVFQKFGFQKMTPDRFAKISKTDQFRFGFLVRFFG